MERLKTLEMIWESLSADERRMASPAWHEVLVSRRLEKIKSGKAKFLTLEQVKRRLRRAK